MKKAATNFGELYRAAFAERDPERKLVLLSEVQRELNRWEQADESAPVAHLRMEPRSDVSRVIRAA